MKFAGTMDRSLLRRVLHDVLRETEHFPLEAEFEALVVGERMHAAPAATQNAPGVPGLALTGTRRYLEVVPTGYAPEALDLLGPILIPTDRPLQEGSLLTASVGLLDPADHPVPSGGLLAERCSMRVRVAVEP